MDIVYLFKLLYKNKFIIASVTFIGLLAAFLLTMNMKKTYVSTAKLATGFTVSKKINIDEERFNIYEATAKFNNLMESITSESVLALLSYRLMIHDLSSNEAPFTEPYAGKVDPETPKLNKEEKEIALALFKSNLESLKVLSTYDEFEKKLTEILEVYEYDAESILKNISVKRVNLSDYVVIKFGSHNPRLSAFVVNVLGEEFLRYDAIIYNNQTGQSVDILTRQIEEAKQHLETKTQALENYKTENNLVSYDTETEAKFTKLSEYDDRLKEESNNLRKLQISLSDVNQRIKESGLDTKTESRNKKIFFLREEIDDLNEKFINGGSQDMGLQSRVEAKREELKSLVIAQRATTNNDTDELLNRQQALMLDIRISQANLSSIKQSIASLQRGISGFAQHESALKQLQKELTLASEEYLSAMDKLNKAKNTANVTENTIQIVQFGQPAGEPESSKRGLLIVMAGFVCMITYVLSLLTTAYLDSSIRSPSRIKEQTGLHLITPIPFLTKKQLQAYYSETPIDPTKTKGAAFFHHVNEFFKSIRFEVFQSGKKTILITSDNDQDGKSFLAINLAKSLGLASKKTLIIDANFSNNFITKYYKANPEGLSKALENPHSISDQLSPTQNPAITILGCELNGKSPSEVINGDSFKRLIENVTRTFDYVLIESTSLNTSSGTKELEEYVEMILPIFSATTTLKESDKVTLEYLDSVREKVPGVVLNKVRKENMDI